MITHGKETKEKIQQWKNQYRKIVEIPIVDGNDEYIGYFKTPDIKTIGASQKISKTDDFEGVLTLVRNCWLGGAEDILTDGILFLKASEKVNELFGTTTAEIKNL